MRSVFGFRSDKQNVPLLTQSKWRAAGALCLGVSALMAWGGSEWEALRQSAAAFLVFWGIFFIFFGAAVLIAILDLRYIRLQYALERRAVFQDTLGEEQFRKAIQEAKHKRIKSKLN